MGSLREFETWEPLLRAVRAQNPAVARWAGAVGRGGAVVPRADDVTDLDRAELDSALLQVQDALRTDGLWTVSFSVQYEDDGRAEVRLAPASVDQVFSVPGLNPTSAELVLVDGARPEPVRCQPQAYPARTAPSSDPDRLEQVLRERLPDAVGATDAEIAATEHRLGIALPDELKAVYRVTNAEHGGDWDRYAREAEVLGFVLRPLEELHFTDTTDRGLSFEDAATVAVTTSPSDAVQVLITSPGWLVIGDLSDGSGVPLCLDLTPGPVEDDSVREPGRKPPAVVLVNSADGWEIQRAAGADLEVLQIGWLDTEPTDLAPLIGLPRLRTLTAMPGKIADPLVIAKLTGLEYLRIGLDEWEALVAADAVPPSLLAAGISRYDNSSTRARNMFDALRSRSDIAPQDAARRTIAGRLTL
ncbi:SMI1/KNR4 family protein [Antribacter gilvus]|uniref:SMI1/KNR4 family protein n=1 Tax=Antribacter gilvus TaxID=2304675 RepID=UPI000F77D21E|nr:SMI1/KNR4 family protein [Antribacter gilvus]